MKLEIYQTETIKNVLNECFGLQKLPAVTKDEILKIIECIGR